MFRQGGKNRLGAAIALVAVLALGMAVPAGASGWDKWREMRDLGGGLLARVTVWLGLAPASMTVLKCDQGAIVDPNGCPKAAIVHGSTEISRTSTRNNPERD